MEAIKCDVCNGALEMEAGGRTATCVVCGMRYSVERLQEKLCATQNFEGGINVGNIKISEDTEQLKTLLVKYLDSFDYNNALHIINRILEAAPTDAEANKIYDRLQELKYFEIKNKVLVKYSGTSKEVAIPDGIIEIAKYAFSYKPDSYGFPDEGAEIEKLIIPDTVVRIGDYACARCEKLKEVVWGKGLVEIGQYAFSITAISVLNLPNNIRKINEGAFQSCEKLTSVVLPNGIEEIATHTFSYSALEQIVFGNSIKKLGDYSFYFTKIKKLDLSNSIEEIGDSAFGHCSDLVEVILGESVVVIADCAFQNTSISEITIPSKVTSIGAAFAKCEKLTEVKILSDNFDNDEEKIFSQTPYINEKHKRAYEQRQREEVERERRRQEEERQEDLRRKAARRQNGVCQYCGGTFSGLFTKKCTNCGRVKDY